jgi:hypothetical protein
MSLLPLRHIVVMNVTMKRKAHAEIIINRILVSTKQAEQ